MSKQDLQTILNVKDFIGRAPEQVTEFISEWIDPLLTRALSYGSIDKEELKV